MSTRLTCCIFITSLSVHMLKYLVCAHVRLTKEPSTPLYFSLAIRPPPALALVVLVSLYRSLQFLALPALDLTLVLILAFTLTLSLLYTTTSCPCNRRLSYVSVTLLCIVTTKILCAQFT